MLATEEDIKRERRRAWFSAFAALVATCLQALLLNNAVPPELYQLTQAAVLVLGSYGYRGALLTTPPNQKENKK